MSSEPFVFEASARLQRLLSQELISDPNLAVIELVKNGYDAGADTVLVDLKTTDGAGHVALPILTISDDGAGMSPDEFRTNWMRPGYSEKARNPGTAISVRGKRRVPTGEKGLGRLAAGRLGDKLTIFTRKRRKDPWFSLMIDWRRFEDMDSALADIEHSGRLVEDAPSLAFPFGTILIVEQMTVDLTAKIPGRKVAGRSDTRFGRLSQDLQLLTASAEAERVDFRIELRSDAESLLDQTGDFKPEQSLAPDQFRYEWEVRQGKNGIEVRRTAMTGVSGSTQVILQRRGPLTEVGQVNRAPHPTDLESGPIAGVFTFAPPLRGQREPFVIPPGVYLYRDGFRVDPYGDIDSDWVGAYSRKASRQGYAPIQPKYLFGRVDISRADNPNLKDMSNRQGLIENGALQSLLAHVRAEFAFFEQIVSDHAQKPRWAASQATKRQSAAQERVEVTRQQSRAFAHAVRQPLAGFSAELFQLRQLVDDPLMPAPLAERLAEIVARLGTSGSDIRARVETYLNASDDAVSTFDLRDLYAELALRTEPVRDSTDALLQTMPDSLEMTTSRSVLLEALVELVTNAAVAPKVPGRRRVVTVVAAKQASVIQVLIGDNGPGLPPSRVGAPFDRGATESGKPGQGLMTQRLNLIGAGADLVLSRSSTDGAVFEIRLNQPASKLEK